MPIKRKTAREECMRLSALPFWTTLSDATFGDLVGVLEVFADDEKHASAAITKCLRGAKIPLIGELEDAINETRVAPAVALYPGGCCGRVSAHRLDSNGQPSRCRNGWVHERRWHQVGKLVTEEGNPVVQPYDYSGRCVCVGGTVTP